jgi:hypothetical protein
MMEFSGFYESHEPSTSGNARGIVPPHCDGHQNGKQSGYISHHCCVDCCPGGRLGDMEHQVIARWRRPVASGEALLWWRPVASDEALVMLHRVMCSISQRRTAMAMKMACEGHHRLF